MVGYASLARADRSPQDAELLGHGPLDRGQLVAQLDHSVRSGQSRLHLTRRSGLLCGGDRPGELVEPARDHLLERALCRADGIAHAGDLGGDLIGRALAAVGKRLLDPGHRRLKLAEAGRHAAVGQREPRRKLVVDAAHRRPDLGEPASDDLLQRLERSGEVGAWLLGERLVHRVKGLGELRELAAGPIAELNYGALDGGERFGDGRGPAQHIEGALELRDERRGLPILLCQPRFGPLTELSQLAS